MLILLPYDENTTKFHVWWWIRQKNKAIILLPFYWMKASQHIEVCFHRKTTFIQNVWKSSKTIGKCSIWRRAQHKPSSLLMIRIGKNGLGMLPNQHKILSWIIQTFAPNALCWIFNASEREHVLLDQNHTKAIDGSISKHCRDIAQVNWKTISSN